MPAFCGFVAAVGAANAGGDVEDAFVRPLVFPAMRKGRLLPLAQCLAPGGAFLAQHCEGGAEAKWRLVGPLRMHAPLAAKLDMAVQELLRDERRRR